MKVLFLTVSDETIASSRTRVFQYLPYLEREGIGYRVLVYTPARFLGYNCLFLRAYHLMILSLILVLSIFYPVVFIQKLIFPRPFLTVLKIFGKKVIFDFDDAIYTVHQSGEKLATRKSREKTLCNFIHTVAFSDLIILENDHNKKIVDSYNTNIMLITGPIDVERYCPLPRERERDNVVIGWIGSPQNTFYLEPLFPVFKRICATYDQVSFCFIGSAALEIADVDLRLVKWDLQTEVMELQNFDIGIMPLPDDEWTRGKGGYKLLQYMALGIPSVASPVGINDALIQESENGFLATTEQEWFDRLSYLVEHKKERERMGVIARKTAVMIYSFDIAASRLIESMKGL
jgi:glycosyltransferase involved in cell wall biosynthesis